jgi:hypothetical protein
MFAILFSDRAVPRVFRGLPRDVPALIHHS